MSFITVGTSVQGGYNGGATITITVDGTTEFTATSSDTWNRVYNNTSADVTTSVGTLHIQINEPGSTEEGKTKHLEIVLSVGSQTETQDIAPNGANNSYGYSYSDTRTLNGAAVQVHKYRVRTTDTGDTSDSLAVDCYMNNDLISTFNMYYGDWSNRWKEFDGLIKVGYSNVESLKWTVQIIDNIQGYSTGDNISWMYNVRNDVTLEEVMPYVIKYLLKSGNDYYTIQNDTLTNIGSTLNAQLFANYGLDSIPDYADYSSLSAPSIYKWSNGEFNTFDAITTGVAEYPQTVISEDITLEDTTTTGIESITATCEGNPLFAVSLDSGLTWKSYDATNNRWVTLSQAGTGMTAEVLGDIASSTWADFVQGATTIKIRFSLITTSDKVTKVVLDYTH